MMALLYHFFILLIAVVCVAAFIIKPWLASRLKNTPPNDYPNWFIVNDAGKPLKVNKELSRFVRERYRTRKDDSPCRCQRYLHVFSHTTEGKPLALLFDADDKVVNWRYLDAAINPAIWRYAPRIDDRCIDHLDNWRDYFINVYPQASAEKNRLATSIPPANAALAALAWRYDYTILSPSPTGEAQRGIVIRFTDRLTARSWAFELTGVTWTTLRHYAKPADLLPSDNDNCKQDPLARLRRFMPVSWLIRPDVAAAATSIDLQPSHVADTKADPCFSEAQGRAIIGKRAVTLTTFYSRYLRGLQLPSPEEAQSQTVKNALQCLYFDCQYDKGDRQRVTDAAITTKQRDYTDWLLYPIVPFLRRCPDNKKFDELRQICQ